MDNSIPPPATGFELGDIYYYTLFRHKWKIPACSLAGFGAAVRLFFKLTPSSFESEARLFIRYVVNENKSIWTRPAMTRSKIAGSQWRNDHQVGNGNSDRVWIWRSRWRKMSGRKKFSRVKAPGRTASRAAMFIRSRPCALRVPPWSSIDPDHLSRTPNPRGGATRTERAAVENVPEAAYGDPSCPPA